MNKPKIAICLFGYVGVPFSKSMNYEENKKILNKNNRIDKIMLELSYQHLMNDIINCNSEYDFDIFIHSWNNKIKDDLVDKFKPKKYCIEELITEHNINTENHGIIQNLSRLLGTVKVLDLVKDYQESEDYYQQVILLRFDLVFLCSFPLSKYIDNNIKIVDGFHKGNWGKQPDIYNDKTLEAINKKYKGTNLNLDFINREVKEIRIIEKLFMSNFKNIYNLTRYYFHLINLVKQHISIDWNPHIYYSSMLLDIITKNNDIEIKKIKEIYYEGINEGDHIPLDSTLLLTKQAYFRNPGLNCSFGTITGNINCRLVDIKKLLEEYDIPEEIIINCV